MKQFIFTYFQPAALLAVIAFWIYAPDSIATTSTAIGIGIGFKALLLIFEWISPRYKSWRLTWKEAVTDLFYVGLMYTVVKYAGKTLGSEAFVHAVQHSFHWDKFTWFTGLPLLVQALIMSLIFDFGQYWMHRGMHKFYPLWLPHSVHHYITQLNINKGAVGNPVELFLIGLGVGGFFDFLPRAVLLAGSLGLFISIYQHINVRFNTPNWWRFVFNTTEHHSLHHSRDYEATCSNYANTYIFIDRIFGTCVDGEAELLGQEGGRRMTIAEQMYYPFTEAYKSIMKRFQRQPSAIPAE